MPIIEISVKNKVAASPKDEIVCGNSDYQIKFAFDDEWAKHKIKTARFSYGGKYEDVVFNGDTCNAPVISGATVCAVGVYAGDLQTTTPALIACQKSILCGGGLPADPAPDVYKQIMEMLNNMGGGGSGISPTIDIEEIDGGHRITITDANGTQVFDVADGKDGVSPFIKIDPMPFGHEVTVKDVNGTNTFYVEDGKPAYDYALDGGYAGTEEDFAKKLAEEMPDTLPNPHKLTFTGAANAEYDGSKAVEVKIPQGGADCKCEEVVLQDITLTETVSAIWLELEEDLYKHYAVLFYPKCSADFESKNSTVTCYQYMTGINRFLEAQINFAATTRVGCAIFPFYSDNENLVFGTLDTKAAALYQVWIPDDEIRNGRVEKFRITSALADSLCAGTRVVLKGWDKK